MESLCREREGVCFEIEREGVCAAIEKGCVEREECVKIERGSAVCVEREREIECVQNDRNVFMSREIECRGCV